MTAALLTPADILRHFGRKDRHWLRAAVNRGLIEAVNIGGEGHGARWRYRLKPDPQPPDPEDLHWLNVKKRHGW